MALFAVNRYGDNCNSGGEDRERENLSILQKKIEDRLKAKLQKSIKLKIEETTTQPEETITNDNNETILNDYVIKDETPDIRPQIQFKVLGVRDFAKKQKIKRVLPYWLSHPTPISVDLKSETYNVNNIEFLHNSLKKKLNNEKIESLFPVQAQVVPWLLEEHKNGVFFWPRDVCVSAPTGSGKTLAYVLPIVQILSSRIDRQIRALVVLPVKELAMQVAKVFKDYCIGTNLKVASITGSMPFTQEQLQLMKYTVSTGWQSEVDIVVCTAGRLVEHLQFTEGFSLQYLQFLVIDEADRIMQHIQNDWLYHLNRHTELSKSIATGKAPPLNYKTLSSNKRPPQKLFFSATLSHDPEKLKEWGLFQPKLFSVVSNKRENDADSSSVAIDKYATPSELIEQYLTCEIENKPAILYTLLKERRQRVLCFTNSAQSTHRLTVLLKCMVEDATKIAEISASFSQKMRDLVLKKFQTGIIDILISTDALARGIDISNCDNVISYDPPKNVKTYIHRVGRTGRAGRSGLAITILTHNQYKPFQEILKTTGKTNVEKIEVPEEQLQNALHEYERAAAESQMKLDRDLHRRVDKMKSLKRGRVLKPKNRMK